MIRKTLYTLCCLALLVGCSHSPSKKDPTKEDNSTAALPDKPTEVRAKLLKAETFHYEVVSNGTVAARRKADLKFQSSDVVTRIYVKNGDRVTKGQQVASMDAFKLQNSMEQAKDNMDRAELNLQDVLIGQGYSMKQSASIPADVLKIAKVQSNYEQSRISYELAAYNLKNTTLYAPFGGIVANLTTKENNAPDGSTAFCTLVDMDHPEVAFKVLENELTLIKKGDAVLVSPFSNPNNVCKGVIGEINPVIDKNGMVSVRALLDNPKNSLFDGMNVRVRVQRATDKQLLIPKTALVLRNNRKVVFTAKNGQAQWVYVQTSLENSESYVITEGLQVGDSVIYEGNINLAHEAPIVVVE